jgi:hypothetical protein
LKKLLKGAFISLILLLAFFFQSCRIKSYLKDKPGQYLLAKVKIKGEPKGTEEDISSFERQKPNHKLFGIWRFHMWYYIVANNRKNRKISAAKTQKLQDRLDFAKRKLARMDTLRAHHATDTPSAKQYRKQQKRVKKAVKKLDLRQKKIEYYINSVWE